MLLEANGGMEVINDSVSGFRMPKSKFVHLVIVIHDYIIT